MDEINGVADGPDVAEAGVGPPDEDDAYDSDEQPDWDNIISLIKKCPTRGGGSAAKDKIEQVALDLKSKYKDALSHTAKPFLHHLLDERATALRCPQRVLEVILSCNPASIQLPMKERDDHPLTIAIKDSTLRRRSWPETMIRSLETYFEEAHLEPMLQNENREGEKCVQASFDTISKSDPLSLSLLRKLVSWSTGDMLKSPNTAGLLPLQLAVMYEQSFIDPEQQPKLVRELLDKCGSCLYTDVPANVAFKTVYFNGTLASPATLYQWHNHTKSNFRQPPPPPSRKLRDGRDGPSNIPSGSTVDEKPSGKPLARRPTMNSNAPKSPRSSSRNRDATNEKPSENLPLRGPPPKNEKDDKREDREKPAAKPKSEQAVAAKIETAELEHKKRKAELASKKVCQELKLRCLRATIETPTTNDGKELILSRKAFEEENYAVKFLDISPGTYLHLDFSEHPRGGRIKESVVKEFFSTRQVNTTLRYLSIPQVEVELEPDPLSSTVTEYPDSRMFFFDWLRTEKKVEKILKVIVDDMVKPHRNEAIEEAIGEKGLNKTHSFGVEILQWRKIDICPETVARAAPNVRELHLEWSGSNAALLGWSDPDGLPKLEYLKQVHLSYNTEVEGERIIDQYIAKFKRRLDECRNTQRAKETQVQSASKQQSAEDSRESRKPLDGRYPNIAVFKHAQVPDDGGDGKQTTDRKKSADDPKHEWLKYMDSFVQYVPSLNEIRSTRPNIDDIVSGNVRVALIDDGVDIFTDKGITNREERARILDGESFDLANGRQLASQHYSHAGHGTLMAKLILAVCPHADIVPYRVLVRPDSKTGKPSPDPESVAKAIIAAIKEGVDIISMSWTILGNSKGQDESKGSRFYGLENAFASMHQYRIPLLFCSAADDVLPNMEGKKEYPSSCKAVSGNIFRIGAARSTGETWAEISTDTQKINYYFPGVKVPDLEERFMYELKKLDHDPMTRSGSSIATAFAAGLAALILHLTKLAIYVNNTEHIDQVHENDLKKLRGFGGMDAAFKKITTKNLTDQQFGYPAKRFEESTLEMERLYKSRRLEIPGRIMPIARLVRNIIDWRNNTDISTID